MSPHSLTVPSALEDLSASLSADVSLLNEYFDSQGGVQPSFERNTPTVVVPVDAPLKFQEARERIMDQCLKILQLATGPSDYMINIQTGYHYVACLQWLCHFNIFRSVPLKGEISYADLAKLADTTETRLKSIVRMAMTTGLFLEETPQHVSHSATSALFATDENYHNWAVYATDVSAPVAAGMAEAHKRWPHDTEKTHTAYNVAFNHDLDFFQRLGQNPALHKQFAGYMRAVATNQGTDMKHLVNGLDWQNTPHATIVDVGGSTGHSSIALAQKFTGLNFIVQDLPEVVDGGPAILQNIKDTTIANRIKYQAHSFFDTNPVIGADFYLLRMILHDWNFENSVKILKAIVPAMREWSNIVVMDSVLPAPGSVPRSSERIIRVRDLTMTQVFNAQERAVEDWEAILHEVDERLVIKKISQPFGSVLALLKIGFA